MRCGAIPSPSPAAVKLHRDNNTVRGQMQAPNTNPPAQRLGGLWAGVSHWAGNTLHLFAQDGFAGFGRHP